MSYYYWVRPEDGVEPIVVKFSFWMIGNAVGNLISNVGKTMVHFGNDIASVSVASANYGIGRLEMHDKATLEIEDLLNGITENIVSIDEDFDDLDFGEE